MPDQAVTKRKRGRPATGITRKKLSVTVPINLLDQIEKTAAKKGLGLSNFITQTLQSAMAKS